MGLLTCLFALGQNVGVQNTLLKHCATLHSELQQKPVKEELKPTTISSILSLFLAQLQRSLSVYVNNEDSVKTPPTHYCLGHNRMDRHRVLSALVHSEKHKCRNISQVVGTPPRTLAHLTNHGHPVWPLAMPASLLGFISLCEEGEEAADSHLIHVLASQADNHSLKPGIHRPPLEGDTHLYSWDSYLNSEGEGQMITRKFRCPGV